MQYSYCVNNLKQGLAFNLKQLNMLAKS